MIRLSIVLFSAICIHSVCYANSTSFQSDTSIKKELLIEDRIVSFVFNYYQPELKKLKNEVYADLQIASEDGNKQINYTKDGSSYYYRIIPSVNGFL